MSRHLTVLIEKDPQQPLQSLSFTSLARGTSLYKYSIEGKQPPLILFIFLGSNSALQQLPA